MHIAASVRRSLEGLGRRTKFGVLMLAAWTPVLLPSHPFLAAIVLSLASGVFLAATGLGRTPGTAEPAPDEAPRAHP